MLSGEREKKEKLKQYLKPIKNMVAFYPSWFLTTSLSRLIFVNRPGFMTYKCLTAKPVSTPSSNARGIYARKTMRTTEKAPSAYRWSENSSSKVSNKTPVITAKKPPINALENKESFFNKGAPQYTRSAGIDINNVLAPNVLMPPC